jgi:hypothetical protein
MRQKIEAEQAEQLGQDESQPGFCEIFKSFKYFS